MTIDTLIFTITTPTPTTALLITEIRKLTETVLLVINRHFIGKYWEELYK